MVMKQQSFVALAAAVLLAAGCAGPPDSSSSGTGASAQPLESAVDAPGSGPLGAPTARDIIKALSGDELEILHPVDNTSRECPVVGCVQSVVTDRLRVKSFATTGQAQIYAADRGLMQVETVVVEFAPAVSEAERQRYWSDIVAMVS